MAKLGQLIPKVMWGIVTRIDSRVKKRKTKKKKKNGNKKKNKIKKKKKKKGRIHKRILIMLSS